MTTLVQEPRSLLGIKLQDRRTDRPDEWSMDEYTRMAEKLHTELEAAKQELAELKASLPNVRAEAVREAAESCGLYISSEDATAYYGDLLDYATKLEQGE